MVSTALLLLCFLCPNRESFFTLILHLFYSLENKNSSLGDFYFGGVSCAPMTSQFLEEDKSTKEALGKGQQLLLAWTNKCIHTYKLRTAECTKTHNASIFYFFFKVWITVKSMWAFCWHTAYKKYKGAGKCMFSKINSYNILICVLYWLIAWLIDTGLLQLYLVHISPIWKSGKVASFRNDDKTEFG